MPRKNVIVPINILSAGSMTGDLTSNVTNIQFLDNIGIQFNWTGTAVGSFFVDVSNDNSNWNTLTLSPAPAAAGSSSTAYVDLNQMSAAYVRARYTHSSSTGTLNVYLTAKEI